MPQGVSLGYDPFGDLHIAHTTAHQWTQITSAKLVVSGIHSSHAMITLEEDPTTNEGVPTSFDFAILLELPDAPQTTEFEVDLKVEASVSRRLEESVRRMLGRLTSAVKFFASLILRIEFDLPVNLNQTCL